MAVHGRDDTVERPRAVFLAACEELARRATPAGFGSVRKSQELVRRLGPWLHRISFASSGYNRAGEFVALTPTVTVWNNDLQRWRRETGGRSDGFVASRMLYRFAEGSVTSTWDLADPTARNDVLDEVMSIIDYRVIAWLNLFDDRLEILTRWNFDDELLELDAMAELLVFLGRLDEATAVVHDAMTREPWSRFSLNAQAFANLRKLAVRFSVDFPVPPGSDPMVEAAAVARLREASDAQTHRQ